MDKIKSLDELESTLDERREENTIAHCHGVFDLLHVGHIRHLREASEIADLLVVTVTPDEYVNKGPNRPEFDENKRLEVLSALDFVDYVALNRWPKAVKTLEKLKPDYYVKGPDYEDKEADRTGGIHEEEAAAEAVDCELYITSDVKYSSSNLLNRHFADYPEEVKRFLDQFRKKYSTEEIVEYLEGCSELDVLVVGEAIVDEYRYCETIGASTNQPALTAKHRRTEKYAGGNLAVANHIADFAGETTLLTMLGENQTQEEFVRSKLHPEVEPRFFYRSKSPTITKRRFMDEYFFNKLFSEYIINDSQLSEPDEAKLCEMIESEIEEYDLVVVVDFGHQMLTRKAIDIIREKANYLAVNAQSNAGNLGYQTIQKFESADFFTMATHELLKETRKRHGDLRPQLKQVADQLQSDRAIVTRGSNGCLTFDREDGFDQIPALAEDVTDRVGAGDAFLSIASMCVYQEAPMEVAGFIGNAVGAEAVDIVGNESSIKKMPLIKHIETLMR